MVDLNQCNNYDPLKLINLQLQKMSESGHGSGSSSRNKDEEKKVKPAPKNAKSMSTSAKRMQKELGEITLDPPPNCRYWCKEKITINKPAKLVSGKVLIQNLVSALVQKETICMSGCQLYLDPRVPRTRAESSSLTSTSPPSTPSSLQKWPSEHEFTTATSTPRESFVLTFSKTTGVQPSQFLRYVLKYQGWRDLFNPLSNYLLKADVT